MNQWLTKLCVPGAVCLAVVAASPALATMTVSDTGTVKNTVLKITVTGAAGPVTIESADLGIELVGCKVQAAGVACITYSGVASTTPRKGWKLKVKDGTRTVNHTVTTSLGLGPTGPVFSLYNIDPSQSQLTAFLPDQPPIGGPLSGFLRKNDIDVDSDPSSPTYGQEDFILPADQFTAQMPTPLGLAQLQFPGDVPGAVNLSPIWNATCTCADGPTGTAVDIEIPLVITGLAGLPPITVVGVYSGEIDFAPELHPAGEPFGEIISGFYTAEGESPFGPVIVKGPIVLTGSTFSQDEDDDGVADEVDNCLGLPNPSQADADQDLVGDACDKCPGTGPETSVGLDGCPLPPLCIQDLNEDGIVNAADLAQLLGAWGPTTGCEPADLNKDGFVNAADLALLLGRWGPCG